MLATLALALPLLLIAAALVAFAVRTLTSGTKRRTVAGFRFHDADLWRAAKVADALGATMAAAATQVSPAQSAGRPQPQTTTEPPGGPFLRHTQPGRRQGYAVTGQAFGALVTQPLPAVPGYVRGFRVRFAATGGAGTSTVAVTADAPFNTVALVQVKDAFGTPLIVAPGYEALYLIPKYSAQFGLLQTADVRQLPSWSAPVVGAGASGNFTFSSFLPLEFAKAYGVISGANASLLPTIQFTLNPSATVYSTAPNTTVPVLECDVDTDFYWLPEGVDVSPPGLGSTCQWVLQQCNPPIGSASTTAVQLPRLGGYLATVLLILRDSTGARVDAWGTRIQFIVDGVPLIDTRQDTLFDDVAIQYGWPSGVTGGPTRDTGVLPITRKTSLGQLILGLLDTGEHWLSTNPGTLIQIQCAPWGTISNAPAQLNVLAAQVVPSGALIQGLPEL